MIRTANNQIRALTLVDPLDPSATKFRVRYKDSVTGQDVIKAIGDNNTNSYTCAEWYQMFGHSPDPNFSVTGSDISMPEDCSFSDTDPANQGAFVCANAATTPGSLWACGYEARFPYGFDGVPGVNPDTGVNDDPSYPNNMIAGGVADRLSQANLHLKGFSPIGTATAPFKRKFNGNGHTISGLFISRGDYSGLFGAAATTIIQNVILSSAKVAGANRVGALVGSVTGTTISDSSIIDGTVAGTGSAIGGMVGYASSSSIFTNDSFKGAVSGVGHVGGLVGSLTLSSKISNSHIPGSTTVAGTGNYIGGLVGFATGSTIVSDSFLGEVSGIDYVGGLVGYSKATSISLSYHHCSVRGHYMVGGLVGYNLFGPISESYSMGIVIGSTDVGGLVGTALNSPSISCAYSTGAVHASSQGGGLVGSMLQSSVSNSYATGEVTGGAFPGGLVGMLKTGASVSNSFSAGKVTGTQSVGGFAGQYIQGNSTISSCAWVKNNAPNAIGSSPAKALLHTPPPVLGEDKDKESDLYGAFRLVAWR